MINFATT